jgi:hypothetical protein
MAVNAKNRSLWQICCTFLLVGLIVGLGACGKQKPSPPMRAPTPTPLIRHRDALPLMIALDDLGDHYALVEMIRLERGKGWSDETTRLSGYRHVYEGSGSFSRIVCQVECYLSVRNAQTAYRIYKEQLVSTFGNDERYAAVNESEASGLGEWGAMLRMRDKSDQNRETIAFLFVRENVLTEITLEGTYSSDLIDRAVRQAKVVDQRILAR